MKFLKVNEAARALGCSEAFLRRAEQNGKIPRAKRDINKWRVYDDEDIRLLRELLSPTNGNSNPIINTK
jgi:DNA-binding transcriptional MerR regulator